MALFLVTGVGHSGTGWAARVFTELGHPCGHERWHTPAPYAGMDGPDASWLAVPRLPLLPAGVPVVHLVRDPLAVVRSMLRIGFLGDGKHRASFYDRFVYAHQRGIETIPDHLGRVIAHVARWDVPLAGTGRLLRVEDATVERTAGVIEYATGTRPDRRRLEATLAAFGTRVNRHAPERTHMDRATTWARIAAHPLGGELIARAKTYGYDVEG